MSIRIIIVEDDHQVRQQISAFLAATPDFDVVGSFGSAEEALKENLFGGTQILLTDIELPGISGIELIRQVKPVFAGMHAIVLTVFEDDDHVFSALKAGAVGYLLKGARPTKLLDAIDEVMAGGSPMSGTIARKVINTLRESESYYSDQLTDRENTLLAFLAEGYRYKEIADKTGISIETVRTHIRNIYQKLQVQSRTEALNKIKKGNP
ncbi:MAG: response regulator transcription factor [Flavobacteriales bacterium]|nr:response regulator transcription factor [Flavobacteriales bacterium]